MPDNRDKNIVDLAAARAEQKKKLKEQKKAERSLGRKGFGFWAWFQFAAFLLFMAYVMKSCGG